MMNTNTRPVPGTGSVSLNDGDLFKRLAENQAEIQKLQAQSEQIEAKVRKLKAQSNILVNKYLIINRVRSNKFVDKYAQATCRELCTAVLSKFPREIRDRIYEHFCFEHGVFLWFDGMVRPNVSFKEHILDPRNWQEHYCEEGGLFRHCFDRKYVGSQMLGEIMERFFAGTSIEMDRYDKLEGFLVDRSLGGVAPGDFLRKLHLDINGSILRKQDNDAYMARGYTSIPWQEYTHVTPEAAESLQRALRSLLTVKRPRGFQVTFVVQDDDGELSVQRWQEIMWCIRPVCQELREKGFILKINLEFGEWDELDTDLTPLQDAVPAEWAAFVQTYKDDHPHHDEDYQDPTDDMEL